MWHCPAARFHSENPRPAEWSLPCSRILQQQRYLTFCAADETATPEVSGFPPGGRLCSLLSSLACESNPLVLWSHPDACCMRIILIKGCRSSGLPEDRVPIWHSLDWCLL